VRNHFHPFSLFVFGDTSSDAVSAPSAATDVMGCIEFAQSGEHAERRWLSEWSFFVQL
jgi:hypothetical protein